MRIHLPLHPEHFQATASGPLARIGGELVLIELQGELEYEGDKAGGVVGVLGLDNPDRPTLHIGAHHLLHGKMATLNKPYAVIRRVNGDGAGAELEGDAEDEEEDAEAEAEAAEEETPKKRAKGDTSVVIGANGLVEEEDDDRPPFPDAYATPAKSAMAASSSPWIPSSARDYSSDLSSPLQPFETLPDDDEEEEERLTRVAEKRKREKEEERRLKRKALEPERTRHYEVAGVVRKKLVFALRPEPLVQPTQLPE